MFTELSPRFLLTNIVDVSSIFNLFKCNSIRISDKIIKPSPIFPHLLIIILVALFE